jgi:NAD-dependent deacetylase
VTGADPGPVGDLAEAVAAADGVAALTGAGVSTASGIPQFRGEDGIWGSEFDPADFHYSRFQSDPGGFWTDRLDLAARMYPDDAAPNAAHEALAELERRGHLDAVITQNVDGLHGEAGSETVIELHGNSRRAACEDCGGREPIDPVMDRVRDGERPPRCACGGVLKPDTVLFGEQLPTGALEAARTRAREAEVFLAVGSSLQVQPAASLPRLAKRSGARLAVINLEETPVTGDADDDIRADVTAALPALVDAL